MKFLIPLLGKTRESYLDAGIRDYAGRLRRYATLDMPLLKERHVHGAPDERTMFRQAEELLACCSGAQMLVALDPGGAAVSSEDLAQLLTRWEEQGRAEIAFLIGGHLGLHTSVLERANYRLSISSFTFTHEISRLLLLEQLYRACTIRVGHNYHL
ncbi:MAG: 23S rRNA (pseudouridine(1915)-N(3))-methyltransferase RlmH [Desulfobulbaceae bacterium]|nr:23S rRNA (pseudouridine(1915)-N(3))-methyltransferase RlmH [Desulfobulbaceae bacterium]